MNAGFVLEIFILINSGWILMVFADKELKQDLFEIKGIYHKTYMCYINTVKVFGP